VDFHITENRKAHKTDDYEVQQLIIRRGQTFDVTVTFNREYQPDNDVIILQFVTGWQLSYTRDEVKFFKRLVVTSDGVVVGVVIRKVQPYDLVKIKPTESEAEHRFCL